MSPGFPTSLSKRIHYLNMPTCFYSGLPCSFLSHWRQKLEGLKISFSSWWWWWLLSVEFLLSEVNMLNFTYITIYNLYSDFFLKFALFFSFYRGSDQIRSVAQSCPTLCDPRNRSTPGLPVHHQLPQFTQTHVHRVSDAIQPSHPLSSPSPPAPNPSQHHSLFQWVNSSHEVAKVLEFQL